MPGRGRLEKKAALIQHADAAFRLARRECMSACLKVAAAAAIGHVKGLTTPQDLNNSHKCFQAVVLMHEDCAAGLWAFGWAEQC